MSARLAGVITGKCMHRTLSFSAPDLYGAVPHPE